MGYLKSAMSALLVLSSQFITSHASSIVKRSGIIPSTLPGSWIYQGCVTDVGRTLDAATYQDLENMTIESCLKYCDASSYSYAGLEFSSQCWCANLVASTATQTTCGMTCTGNGTESCGDSSKLDLFYSGKNGPQTNTGPGLWKIAGCFKEGANGRTLVNGLATQGGPGNMTVALCTQACQGAGYTLAGVEFGQECWCGNAISNGGSPATLSDCSTTCKGNLSEFCGGPSRLDVYNFNGTNFTAPTGTPTSTPTPSAIPTSGQYSFLDCRTEGTNVRALSAKSATSASMSIELCEQVCFGYNYFGIEYAQECYCGNSFGAGSVPAPLSDCSFACAGNSSEVCGAGNRLSVYVKNGTNTTDTGPASQPSSIPATIPTNWTSQGCWVDGSYGRILLGHQFNDNQDLTVESCISSCASLGYTVAGVEYSAQCFCDTAIRNNGTFANNATLNQFQTDCNMGCAGNGSEICGGPDRMNIYSCVGQPIVFPPATVQKKDLPGSWAYQGCLQDNVNQQRTFPWPIDSVSNTTVSGCLSQCQEFGYNAAGLEDGYQCYCGDVANIAVAGASLLGDEMCDSSCSGNGTTLCGSNNRLSYYAWKGPALYSWDFRTGIDAGAYSLLIGGVCIPLLTSQTVTGKVTFLEKWGTGEPNSTGAYELDLASINNFTQAWRPMHVKTDVFCSGGLTLPDKVGRQINIGGWSGESTFGIRLYWPDGSPGVWGVNDWQENYNEVSLKTARWYPSTMVLANGSILVIGGEVGSNSAPSPSLELLPPTPDTGVLYLDFLNQTDPYNLYPFVAVLPSGIFVQTYNEARILDEDTFDTVKRLPDLPGAVNDAYGGRNYPLEGAMVLLPQYAPYDDLVGVLICGGSTPGPGNALDNCVSTQPEAENPVWAIERMPSLRVMPCMVGLPDGTYLILNGAEHGVAGFGLGQNPNLNALLYDPTKPLHNRFSVMANTTVARLYHSEAIMLLDGRVLVSGSDPQDIFHPEEYRVEVFSPPYLLDGRPRPRYNVQNKDWAYGDVVPFILTSFLNSSLSGNGTVSGIRVSLLGSVVSTHGNTMGQRTIFPEVNCGSTGECLVVAPPNGHVCPPGWYQMFILNGPTPSEGVFVRIGGDPAGLGNWPDAPGFDVPGV